MPSSCNPSSRLVLALDSTRRFLSRHVENYSILRIPRSVRYSSPQAIHRKEAGKGRAVGEKRERATRENANENDRNPPAEADGFLSNRTMSWPFAERSELVRTRCPSPTDPPLRREKSSQVVTRVRVRRYGRAERCESAPTVGRPTESWRLNSLADWAFDSERFLEACRTFGGWCDSR